MPSVVTPHRTPQRNQTERPAGTPVVKSPQLFDDGDDPIRPYEEEEEEGNPSSPPPSCKYLDISAPTVIHTNHTEPQTHVTPEDVAESHAEPAPASEPWAGFPRDVDWGLRRLHDDLPNFASVHLVPQRPYAFVAHVNRSECHADYSIVDFGADGAPGWTRGIGPCILRFAYPRPILPTLLSTRERPLGLFWYIVQKILPFPEQSQDDAPMLLVPAQLVTQTECELLMWQMRGDDDDPQSEWVHGLLVRDELLDIVQQPMPCPHEVVPEEAMSRLRHVWSSSPVLAQHLPAPKALSASDAAGAHIPAPAAGFGDVAAYEAGDDIPMGGKIPEFVEGENGVEANSSMMVEAPAGENSRRCFVM